MIEAIGAWTIWNFIVFGGFWFWLSVAVASIVLIRVIEEDDALPGFIVLAVTAVIFMVFGNFMLGVVNYIYHNPLILLGGVAIYLLAGLLYSVYRWWRYLIKKRKEFDQNKVEWIRREKQRRDHAKEQYNPEDILAAWKKNVADNSLLQQYIPRLSRNKERITCWMTFWPWSLFWYMFRKLFIEIWNNIYKLFQGMFRRIRNSVFKDILSEYADDVEKEEAKLD